MPTPYTFDPSGVNIANKIIGEQHILTSISNRNYHFVVPTYSPFFAESFLISYRDINNNLITLVEGIDYNFSFQFIAASRSCGKAAYGGVSFLDTTLAGVVTLSYQTVGGNWTIDPVQINLILSDVARNPRITSWETVASVPTLFPTVDHEWNLQDLVGMSDVVTKIEDVSLAIANRPVPVLPVQQIINKSTIGLGNVQNFTIASDGESIAGTSFTKYMTPRGVKLAIDNAISAVVTGANVLISLASNLGTSLIGTKTGQTLENGILFVKTIIELRSLNAPSTVNGKTFIVETLGELAAGDTRKGKYYWDSTSALADNGYTVIQPGTNPAIGRWIHVHKDSWLVDGFTATAGQTTYTLAQTPLYGIYPKITLNNFSELIYFLDYTMNANQIIFKNPLVIGDRIDIAYQVKKIDTNHSNDVFYNTFTVVSQSDVHTLSQTPACPNSILVILNDALTLYHGTNFTISSNTLTMIYPVIAGDVIEVYNHNSPFGYGRFTVRSIIEY